MWQASLPVPDVKGCWTMLALAVTAVVWGNPARAAQGVGPQDVAIVDRGLDMSFVYGGGGASAMDWSMLEGRYVPGRYLVDLSVNGKAAGKHILDVTPQERDELCLTQTWLSKAGVYINDEYFRDGYDAKRQCWVLTRALSARVDFDLSTQSLELAIPQKGLQKQLENVEWNYGTNALRMNYNVNANTGKYNTSAFGSADLKANVERWVVSSSATASGGDSSDNQATIAMFTASRALQGWSADLAMGKTSTGDGLLGSTGTYGVTLSRNNSMKPGNLGYAPVFSGIANGPSRVTLTQNGRVVRSEMVPAGPFAITDVALYSSGDVTMAVVGEDGRESSSQIFPLSVVSGQLSPGTHEFSVAAGVPDDDSYLTGGTLAASYGYGLNNVTLRAGSVFNKDWQGVSAGGVVGLGIMGAVSVDGLQMQASYPDGSHGGNKMRLAWNKQLEQSRTGLRLSGSRQDAEYEEISGFDPTEAWAQRGSYRRLKDEWNVGISQPVSDLFNLSLSGWQRDYYPGGSGRKDGGDSGISGSLNTQIKQVSLNFGVSGSQGPHGDNWAMSASVSVPFTLFERRYSSSTSVSSSKDGNVGVSTGISGSLNDRLSYGMGAGNNGGSGGGSSYVNASYAADNADLNSMLNYSSTSGTSGSVSVRGAVLAVPAAEGIMLSRTVSDTVAVVNVKDTPGIKMTSSERLATDASGNLVVPLNSYDWNTVTIDASSLPQNAELSTTSQKVVPANGAVVLMSFDPIVVHRYLLQVTQQNGEFVPGGVWARDSKNTPLGFVANNGVLMINAVDAPGDISLGECRIPAARLQETEKLQEIVCE